MEQPHNWRGSSRWRGTGRGAGCQSFVYLGGTVTQKGGPEEDIKIRLGKARTAFNKLRNISWRSSQLKLSTKLKIFKSNVIAVLPYGCETWRMTKNDATKLDVFLHKNMRRLTEDLLAHESIQRRDP